MKKALVIPTTFDRSEQLIELLFSIDRNVKGWDVIVVAQKYDEAQKTTLSEALRGLSIRIDVLQYPDMQGAFGARKRAYENYPDYDVYCNLDDDMLILPSHGYDKMADFVHRNREVGFVSGNWGRTAKMAEDKLEKMSDTFKKEPVVHTAGGMMFRKDIKDLIVTLPDNMSYDDSEMSALAYIKGYTNYRYMGSVIVHMVVTKGGLHDWRKKYNGVLANQGIFEYKETKRKVYNTENNDYCEPLSSDLTKLAHMSHKMNKKG